MALLVGIVVAIGGSYSVVNADGSPSGPFPPGGIIPFLKSPFPFADYSWVMGLVVSFLIYGILTKLLRQGGRGGLTSVTSGRHRRPSPALGLRGPSSPRRGLFAPLPRRR